MKLLVFDTWLEAPVICGSGLGSSLLKLPAYVDARAAGHSVHVLTSPPKAELLAHAAVVERCFGEPDSLSFEDYDRLIPFGVSVPELLREDSRLRVDPRAETQLKADYDQVSHVRFWRDLLASALGWARPRTPAEMSLAPSKAGLGWAEAKLPKGRPLITLSLSALTNLKRYTRWGEVVSALQVLLPHVQLVLVGQEAPPPEISGRCLDLTKRTTLEQLTAVVALSAVVVGTDGLVTNLAVACGRPTLALFTVIQPEFVIDPALELRAPVQSLVQPGCPLQPCYPRLGNYRSASCPLDPNLGPDAPPRCAEFDAERIAAAVVQMSSVDVSAG